jgi:hypothetical protein
MTLIQREDSRGGVRYGYRIGPADNTRVVSVTITPSGRLTGYSISADPDSR